MSLWFGGNNKMSAYRHGRLACLALIALSGWTWTQVASAQGDIVGFWDQPATGMTLGTALTPLFGFIEDSRERADGPSPVDYLGLPLNEEGRSRALAYDAALLGVPEHVCMRHPSQYSFWGPARLRISTELDANLNTVSYAVGGTFRRADRTIYMDGRSHPPDYAPHTWAGFTTGEWRGNTLATLTTHLKWGWIRRNGVVASDQSTITTFYTRNGNVLTVTWIVHDPVYLTEPYIKSVDFITQPVSTARFGVEPVDAGDDYFFKCFTSEEIAKPDQHDVPHYLPGKNPFVGEEAQRFGIPVEATLGGAATAYPEYRDRLQR
jgi:hypothetical protein